MDENKEGSIEYQDGNDSKESPSDRFKRLIGDEEQIAEKVQSDKQKSIDEQKKRFESRREGLSEHISLDVWHKKDKKPIGNIGLNHIDWVNGWANAFLQIGEPDYWNKDIGTEATDLLMEYAFNELNLNKIQGGVAIDNIGSWSVAGKIGFELEGIRKHEMYIDGKYVDVKIFRLLKEDWLKSRELKNK